MKKKYPIKTTLFSTIILVIILIVLNRGKLETTIREYFISKDQVTKVETLDKIAPSEATILIGLREMDSFDYFPVAIEGKQIAYEYKGKTLENLEAGENFVYGTIEGESGKILMSYNGEYLGIVKKEYSIFPTRIIDHYLWVSQYGSDENNYKAIYNLKTNEAKRIAKTSDSESKMDRFTTFGSNFCMYLETEESETTQITFFNTMGKQIKKYKINYKNNFGSTVKNEFINSIRYTYKEIEKGKGYQGYLPVMEGEKYGYIDQNLDFVLPAIYDNASDFINGTAKIRVGGTEYLIDEEGNQVNVKAPENYTVSRALSEEGRYLSISSDSTNFAITDQEGNIKYDLKGKICSDFYEGRAVIGKYINEDTVRLEEIIDKDGNQVVDLEKLGLKECITGENFQWWGEYGIITSYFAKNEEEYMVLLNFDGEYMLNPLNKSEYPFCYLKQKIN